MKFQQTDLLMDVVKGFVQHYDKERKVFILNNSPVNITLEDVLYLTGLPIKGRALFTTHARDPQGFLRVFGVYASEMREVYTVAQTNVNEDTRLKAVLFVIMYCLIFPNSDASHVRPHFIRFIENLEEVGMYAYWPTSSTISKIMDLGNRSDVRGLCWVSFCFAWKNCGRCSR